MNRAQKVAAKYFRKFKPTIFDSGVGAKLPQEYRKFYNEWRNTQPGPVHYKPSEKKLWERNEVTGEMKRNEDIPLPSIYAKELNQVFSGGEMIIQGFKKKKIVYGKRIPHFWVPVTYRSVIYSEILDKYISVLMTKRATDLIHKYRGLDNYLLQTKACDLQTLAAIGLKRKLMLCLRDKELPYNEEKNKSIIEKYKKFLPSSEEIEWYGLSFTEACKKLKAIEEEKEKASIVPLKHIYRAQLIDELKSGAFISKEEKPLEKSSWLSKIPGLSKLQKDS